MSARRPAVVGTRAGLLLTVMVAILVLVTTAAATAPAATPAPGDPAPPAVVPPAPSTTVLENDFIPADRDLSDCVSALPRPGCGSKARGGWRQGLVFAVLVVALAFISWRILRAARRRRPAPPGPTVSSAGRRP